ncbi:sporulation protein SpoIID [Desulfitobacterium metallireducens DSM 15288]|uniref:Sporulation protein SpoIID n=1 Tax=Desulfitobacterium metallireducens DSM 15288 TaxID=871968 RepID=W0E9D0_9FIRM|nr:sporulation protein SpoIID [Desulfitobacterium metallireducens DSM 15288]
MSTFQRCVLMVLMLFLVFLNAKPCLAQEIPVELVWKYKDAGWIGIQIDEGNYQLTEFKEQITETPCAEGSSLECGWGGLAPIIRLNDNPFQIWRGTQIELRALDSSGVFKIQTPDGESVRYRGSLRLSWKGDHWSLINQIDLEQYLKGVVPIEMSNLWAQDGLEALKAQAVAARTYVVKKLQINSQITDSPDFDQAYLGKEVEGKASTAIIATEGKILVDDQTKLPIDALYSSHNGGYTEKAENVWSNPDTHFSSHPDPYSKGMGGATDQWRFIIGADVLGKTFQLSSIQEVQLDKYPSGRVKKVRMTDQNGKSKEISGRTFVQAFYPFGHPIHSQAFLGSLFEVQEIPGQAQLKGQENKLGQWKNLIEPSVISENVPINSGPRLDRIFSSSLGIRENPSSEGVFIFWGRGWGHGVGMSQWGAYHMAQLGYGYQEILDFYYDNVVLVDK